MGLSTGKLFTIRHFVFVWPEKNENTGKQLTFERTFWKNTISYNIDIVSLMSSNVGDNGRTENANRMKTRKIRITRNNLSTSWPCIHADRILSRGQTHCPSAVWTCFLTNRAVLLPAVKRFLSSRQRYITQQWEHGIIHQSL